MDIIMLFILKVIYNSSNIMILGKFLPLI